jgi:hypothetical protein
VAIPGRSRGQVLPADPPTCATTRGRQGLRDRVLIYPSCTTSKYRRSICSNSSISHRCRARRITGNSTPPGFRSTPTEQVRSQSRDHRPSAHVAGRMGTDLQTGLAELLHPAAYRDGAAPRRRHPGQCGQRAVFISWFKGCIDIENTHPLEGGYLRMKFRRDRRSRLPLEPALLFYPPHWGGRWSSTGAVGEALSRVASASICASSTIRGAANIWTSRSRRSGRRDPDPGAVPLAARADLRGPGTSPRQIQAQPGEWGRACGGRARVSVGCPLTRAAQLPLERGRTP